MMCSLTDCLCCWGPVFPQTASYFTGHTTKALIGTRKVGAYGLSTTDDCHSCMREDFCNHGTNECAHIHRNNFTFVRKLEQRRHLRCRPTTHTNQRCTLPRPIWNWVLTSNKSLLFHVQTLPQCSIDTAWDKQEHANSSLQKWPCRVFLCAWRIAYSSMCCTIKGRLLMIECTVHVTWSTRHD